VTGSVTVDVAGAWVGGAARYAAELRSYLDRMGRTDVKVIGTDQCVAPAWLLRREVSRPGAGRRVAVNNVSFVSPGGPRWTLLRNALHFLTEAETAQLVPKLRGSVRREARVVRLTARRADVLVVPSHAMAERVCRVLPATRNRLVVRAHPVSANSIPLRPRDQAILCPVLFAPYKRMDERLQELLAALDDCGEPLARVRVTASPGELPDRLASEPRIEFLGRIDHHELREAWARSRAIYFPTGLESFGYPLAEARVSGHPVIARDTDQNREIAGSALCGFSPADPDSLRHAVKLALATEPTPDPGPFDPDPYFEWLLGGSR
jgi:glycosyltransferase involved in cell wall biosynthesis